MLFGVKYLDAIKIRIAVTIYPHRIVGDFELLSCMKCLQRSVTITNRRAATTPIPTNSVYTMMLPIHRAISRTF